MCAWPTVLAVYYTGVYRETGLPPLEGHGGRRVRGRVEAAGGAAAGGGGGGGRGGGGGGGGGGGAGGDGAGVRGSS